LHLQEQEEPSHKEFAGQELGFTHLYEQDEISQLFMADGVEFGLLHTHEQDFVSQVGVEPEHYLTTHV